MADLVKRIFLDPSRCIGCRSCVAACRECDTLKGESMIYIDYLERHNTVASSPTLCMHCEEPLAPCAQVCPAQAILVSTTVVTKWKKRDDVCSDSDEQWLGECAEKTTSRGERERRAVWIPPSRRKVAEFRAR